MASSRYGDRELVSGYEKIGAGKLRVAYLTFKREARLL